MTPLTHRQRALIVVTGLSLAVTALACRLVDLQIFRHTELSREAAANREQVVHRQGRRGEILDCNGNLLASSQSVRIVAADPSITISNAPAIARQLAPWLKMDEPSLVARLTGSGKYVRLKLKVDEDTVTQIKSLKIKGLVFEDQFLRTYPNGPLASHVIGFVDNDHKGVQGIEAGLDKY
ncbi:MAG: hypothetical protein WCH84_03080, partial [Verrucomicrobiota bacterium]